MTHIDAETRDQIAREILAKFGALAPYALVAAYVSEGRVKVELPKGKRK